VSAVSCWPSVGYGTLPLRRILVVQTQRMGDVLCATPLITALRRQFPDAHLAALVHAPHDALLEGSPDLDEVLTYDRRTTHRSLLSRLRFIDELRARRFDWALSIHAASSVAFALWQSGIPWRTCVWRYGERKKPHWARMFHQHLRQDRLEPGRHEVEHNLDALRQLGMEPQHEGIRVFLRPEEIVETRALLRARGRDEGRPLAVVHPGHGGGRQEWPPEEYAAVASGLAERGFQVAFTGSAGEREAADLAADRARAPALRLAGELSLRQLAAALAEARLFVSVSTGPMHLASAFRVPCVTLYGPSHLAVERTRFFPYGSPAREVVSTVPCVCRSSRACAAPVCMAGITPEAVLAAADELLQAAAAGASHDPGARVTTDLRTSPS
jgi:heptosyltransferase III